MDIRRITEVGVAVRDLNAATSLFAELFGATVSEPVEIERFDMRYCMCRVGKVDFELMEPTSERGVIAEFLQKRGEGLHHIAFAVDDIDSTMGTLRKKGVQFVDDAPIRAMLDAVDFAGREFSAEMPFAFSRPASIVGILFEFIQYPRGYATP